MISCFNIFDRRLHNDIAAPNNFDFPVASSVDLEKNFTRGIELDIYVIDNQIEFESKNNRKFRFRDLNKFISSEKEMYREEYLQRYGVSILTNKDFPLLNLKKNRT